MQLQTTEIDGKTYALVQDGKPLFKDDAGKEIPVDVPGTIGTITRLNGEAKGHRERAEKAEGALKSFEGITDPAAAIKALDTLKNLDDKKLVDAGEVEKVKSETIKAVEEKFAPVIEENGKLKAELYGEKIGGAFSRSKFITDKLAIPPDMAQARFEKHFKIEDGKTVAYDQQGNKLFSKANPGNPADFEEAMELIVDSYAYKDDILKGSGNSGSGSRHSDGSGGKGGEKTMSREAFDKLPPLQQREKMGAGFTLTD